MILGTGRDDSLHFRNIRKHVGVINGTKEMLGQIVQVNGMINEGQRGAGTCKISSVVPGLLLLVFREDQIFILKQNKKTKTTGWHGEKSVNK